MDLLTAIILFFAAVAGIIASSLCLRQKKALRIVCMVICILLAAALAVYIGLAAIFLDAAQNKPPDL